MGHNGMGWRVGCVDGVAYDHGVIFDAWSLEENLECIACV